MSRLTTAILATLVADNDKRAQSANSRPQIPRLAIRPPLQRPLLRPSFVLMVALHELGDFLRRSGLDCIYDYEGLC